MDKKRITTEEYNKLPEEEKKKFKEMHFDENFSPGPGDDIDYSYRLYKEGFSIIVANFWVDHHRMTTNFTDKLKDVYAKNSKYFKKKWGLR